MDAVATPASGAGPLGALLATLWRRGPGRFARHRTVDAVGASDVGAVRRNNEDYFLIADLGGPAPAAHGNDAAGGLTCARPLLVVADGMGGAAGGEVASAMAATIIGAELAAALGERRLRTGAQLQQTLARAFAVANRRILDCGGQDAALRGMGTTATAAAVCDDDLYVAHVGDSRAYLVRERRARRLTKDHSLLQYLIDSGAIGGEGAGERQRHALLRALGTEGDVAVDACHVRLRHGDTVILCTDGLWSVVEDDELAALVTAGPNLRALCGRLLALASERGGHDNATVLLARFEIGTARS